jgi:uncharacterized protein (TIGR02145 family)
MIRIITLFIFICSEMNISIKYQTLKIIDFIFIAFLTFSCEKYTKSTIDYTGETGEVTDSEGNIYKTIGIGTQIWMTQNLKSTKLNDGTKIPVVTKDTNWIYHDGPAICWYNNDSAGFNNIYGPLYNFHTVNTGQICPLGWHVPTDSDWKVLEKYLGGNEVAGGKLKNPESKYWNSPNPCIVNHYNFNALPGGSRRHYKGVFLDIKNIGYWWTSSPRDYFYALAISMSYENKYLGRFQSDTKNAYSIRCLKD